jgi:predicted Zn-dependent protease
MLYRKFFPALIGIMLLAGCATVPITGRSQLSLVSHKQLLGLSISSYKKVVKESEFSTDAEKIKIVENVGKRISVAAKQFMLDNGMADRIRDYQWEFRLIEDDEKINAFAIPGGKVFIYTGLLSVAQGEPGLATVMGHEIAHVLVNHSGERMSQLLLAQLGGITLAAAMKEKSNETQGLAMRAYGMGTMVGAILPYSRIHEKEADRVGLILMAKAGYNPQEAIPFWKRMKKAEKSSRPPEFLSTHPAPLRRIEEIRRNLPEAMEYYQP